MRTSGSPSSSSHPRSDPGPPHPRSPDATRPIRILLVEDNPGDARLLEEILREGSLHYTFTHADRLDAARRRLQADTPDVILLDLSLPDSQGIDTVRRMLETAAAVPILVLSGLNDESVAVAAVDAGAQDYLVKGQVTPEMLGRSIRYAMQRKRLELERIRLLEAEQAMRARLERAEASQRFLVEAGTVLASSLDYQKTLAHVAHLAVLSLADYCVVDLIGESGAVERLEVAHRDRRKEKLARVLLRFPLDRDRPHLMLRALREGKSEVQEEVTDEYLESIAQSPEHRRALRALRPRSSMAVPLVVQRRVVGAILLVSSRDDRRYTAEDLLFAEELAQQAALAIQNARLYRKAQAARRQAEAAAVRVAHLQRVTAALSQALTSRDVVDVVIHDGLAAVGAATGVIGLLSADGERFRLLGPSDSAGASGEAEPREVPAHLPSPLADAVRAGRTATLKGWATLLSRYPRAGVEMLDPLDESWVAIPLIAEGRPIGAIVFGFTEDRHLTRADREFITTCAGLCAQALDRTLLFEREQEARALAEAATRARDEVLAIVAHDLRNPLTAVTMGISMLIPDGSEAEVDYAVVRPTLEMVLRAAEGMDRLIADLLDLTRIEAGRFSIRAAPCDVEPLLGEIRQLFEPAAREKQQQLVVRACPSLPPVAADRSRLVQVLSNLVGNAIKFTPPRGTITVEAEPTEGAVRFAVRDTGPGLPADTLPHVFDRFWQAQNTTHQGTGLGLTIAKGIVEAHRGTIWVESEEGAGTTFHFAVPALPAAPE